MSDEPPPVPTGGTASEPTEALSAVVAKLRAELAGVRTAMRNRAVIEQAKGVLVARLGVTPDEGFDHLVRLSQRTNIKLVEVAAAIVGTTAPDPRAASATEVTDLVDDEMREHLARTRSRHEEQGRGGPATKAGGSKAGGSRSGGSRSGATTAKPATGKPHGAGQSGSPTSEMPRIDLAPTPADAGSDRAGRPRSAAVAASTNPGAAGPPGTAGGKTRTAGAPGTADGKTRTAGAPGTADGKTRTAGAPGTADGKTRVAGGGRAAQPARVEALRTQHQLLSARISAATSYDEVAEAIATAECWPSPSMIIVTLLEPDGAQRLVGAANLSPRARSQWQRIPPHLDVPFARAVRDAGSLLLRNRPAVLSAFPAIENMPYSGSALFAAPLVAADRIVGALGLAWTDPLDSHDELSRYLDALTEPVARKVAELAAPDTGGTGDGTVRADQLWLPVVLEALHDPALVLAPVRAEDRVVDFEVEYANAGARAAFAQDRIEGDQLTLLTAYPDLGSRLLLAEFSRVLADGEPCHLPELRVDATTDGARRSYLMTVNAARLWDRIVMITRRHTDADTLYDQMLEAERIGRIGSFSWDLRTGEPLASPQLHRLFHGGTPAGPIPVDELAACVHDDDLLAVQDAVRRTLLHGKQLAQEFRGAGRLAGRRLRILAEPLSDDDGVAVVRGTVQDVTDERAMESRLRLAEEALASQRRRLEAETRAARALQQALLPTEPELRTADGLSIRGRCRAGGRSGRVNGDWYDAYPLPDRSTVLVVGDVAGSGLIAMTAAARLRYAVRAYAALGLSPGEVATAVNAMLCSLEPERTATLVVARYVPQRRELSWAAAGGGAPLVLTGTGAVRILDGPLGLPVGAVPDTRYGTAVTELAAGDRVLLYSDAVVGRQEAVLARVLGGPAGPDEVTGPGPADDLDVLVPRVMQAVHPGTTEDMSAAMVRVGR